MEVLKGCTGCRICEDMCSYNNFKVFQPGKSSIKIYEIDSGFWGTGGCPQSNRQLTQSVKA